MKPGSVSFAFIHPGQYAACFAESKMDLFLRDMCGTQRLVAHDHGQLGKQASSGGIVSGRNHLAKTFLAGTAEWMLMVDADMGFDSGLMEDLIAAADPAVRPVVGGLAFAHKTDGKSSHYGVRHRCQPTLYDFFEDDKKVGFVPRMVYERDTLTQVAGTGGACLLIHRTALAAIESEYGERWFNTIEHPKGPTTFSEDLSFCVRLAGVGVPLWVHTGIKTTHDKGGVFLDEDFYDRQEAARKNEQEVHA